MKLYEAIAGLRAQVDDSGMFLTSFGAAATAAGDQVIPVQDLAMVSRGCYVLVGTGDTAEGAIITETSALTGVGTVTLAAPLVFDHGAQTPISSALVSDADYIRYLTQAIRHLSTYRPLSKRTTLELVAGQDVYPLPADFLAPDQESFDAAIGGSSEVRALGSYYSLIYQASSQFATSGWGAGTTYGPVNPMGWAPIAGNIYDNPNSGMPQARGAEYRFMRQRNPELIVSPAPAAARSLTFFYNAQHTIPTAATDSSLADDDSNLMLLYAKYLACLALSTGALQVMKYEIEGEKVDRSKAPQEYRLLADTALEKFEAETRFIPRGIKG